MSNTLYNIRYEPRSIDEYIKIREVILNRDGSGLTHEFRKLGYYIPIAELNAEPNPVLVLSVTRMDERSIDKEDTFTIGFILGQFLKP